MLHFGTVTASRIMGIPLEEVAQHRHNLWIGVSFGNRAFTEERLGALLSFALHFTKGRVLVCLPGRMHATNYRYFDGLSRAKALKRAFADEDDWRKRIVRLSASLAEQERAKIAIANYDDICTPTFLKRREAIFREFSEEGILYEDILDVVREIVVARKRSPSKDRLESLALYIIHELPMFLGAVGTGRAETRCAVLLYPGMGKLDELVEKIKRGEEYAPLRERLRLKEPSGVVDIRFEEEPLLTKGSESLLWAST